MDQRLSPAQKEGDDKMSKFRVYVTDQRQPSYEIEREILQECGAELILCNCASPEDIIRQCADADAVLLDMAPMTVEAIHALKNAR